MIQGILAMVVSVGALGYCVWAWRQTEKFADQAEQAAERAEAAYQSMLREQQS